MALVENINVSAADVTCTSGSINTTVQAVIDSLGRIVKPGDDLAAALRAAPSGSRVVIDGDVVLNSSVVLDKAVSITRANGGRILWNGPTNNCIRYVLPVKSTITTGVQFLQGRNYATLPAGHSVKAGDCLEATSSTVRYSDSSSSYTTGQLFFVDRVVDNTVYFTPGVLEGFTSNSIAVTDTLQGMHFDVEIVTVKEPTGTATGVLLDLHCVRDLTGNFIIRGNEDEQYGLAIAGHNVQVNVDVYGITSGFGGVAVPGYGVNVVGTCMRITGSGGRCRHVFEIPSGNLLSSDIEFDMNITKDSRNPLFLYAAGAHANAVGWKARGSVSGSGYLIGDRTGTADISMDFFRTDDGYEYADIFIGDIPPYSTRIHGCATYGANARKNFVFVNTTGTPRNGSSLTIQDCVFRGPVRIVQFKNDAGAARPNYYARILGCVGQAVAFTNRELDDANVTLTISDNNLSSYGLTTTYTNWMLGTSNGCNSYELHMHHNIIDDSIPSGVLFLEGYVGSLSVDTSYCQNGSKPLIYTNVTYATVNKFVVDHATTSGIMNFTIPSPSVFNSIVNVSFCNIRADSTTPITANSIPIVYTGCSFKTSFDASLTSTKRPQAGNVNLSGKALNWNGTNIAI